jgi:CubicO group peptidase (beta-lactamase class C family)
MHRMAALAALFVIASCARAQTPKRDVKDILPQFEKHVEDALRKTGVPGVAVVIVHKDRVVYLKGFGVRKVGEAAKVDGDTVFQLASVSKPLATTAVAALVGEKKIGWDDSVAKHVPEFRLSDPWVTSEATLRDLFCHRSGLPAQAGDALEDMGFSRREIFARLQHLKPAYRFRAGYGYTNFGFTAAGEAAARAAGKEWEDLMAEKVYKPLGMTSSSSRFADYEKASNRAILHVRQGDEMVAKYTRQPDAQSPAGGASSTARDMGNWVRLQLAGGKFDGKQLIPAEVLRETHRPHSISGFSPEGRAGLYGLGWGVKYDDDGRIYLRHSGAFFLGARTEVALLPSEDLGIATLANAFPTGLPEAVNDAWFDIFLHGKVTKNDHVDIWERRFADLGKMMAAPKHTYTKPPKATPPLAAERYTGTYHNDYFGALEIVADGAKLTAVVGPKKVKFPLKHWDRDTFMYEEASESSMGTNGATFRIGPDGHADQVQMDSLEENGSGPFVRKQK